jgi:hypothetical protein
MDEPPDRRGLSAHKLSERRKGNGVRLFERLGEAVEDLVAGLTEEAAGKHGIAARTIRHWLRHVRQAPNGTHGEFARAVDHARAERKLPPGSDLAGP